MFPAAQLAAAAIAGGCAPQGWDGGGACGTPPHPLHASHPHTPHAPHTPTYTPHTHNAPPCQKPHSHPRPPHPYLPVTAPVSGSPLLPCPTPFWPSMPRQQGYGAAIKTLAGCQSISLEESASSCVKACSRSMPCAAFFPLCCFFIPRFPGIKFWVHATNIQWGEHFFIFSVPLAASQTVWRCCNRHMSTHLDAPLMSMRKISTLEGALPRYLWPMGLSITPSLTSSHVLVLALLLVLPPNAL